MWAPVGPHPRPRKVAAAADWLISTHKFVGGGPGRIPLQGSESTEIARTPTVQRLAIPLPPTIVSLLVHL